MEWLNYHHLLYFYMVAREGSIAAACKRLDLSQPTISAQIRSLEKALGQDVFDRTGRSLRLTETGHVVYRYADEIFSLGRELMDTLKGHPVGRPLQLHVGVADVVPKLVAYRLLAPALDFPEPVQLICYEAGPDELLARLSMHEFDLILSDCPTGPQTSVRAYSHFLGEYPVSIFASTSLARELKKGFPMSLNDAPFLLPTPNAVLRRSLDHFFETNEIRPRIIGEFEDTALMKVFGQAGAGAFAGPSLIEKQTINQYQVEVAGRLDAVREQFYVITMERKVKHPAVLAITSAAKSM